MSMCARILMHTSNNPLIIFGYHFAQLSLYYTYAIIQHDIYLIIYSHNYR